MTRMKRLKCCLGASLIAWGCTSAPPPKGVVRYPQKRSEQLEGPFPGQGPFETYWEALLAACPLILSQKNATAGYEGDQKFEVRWGLSKEYCAWLYYTTDDKYELSYVVESAEPIRNNYERGCRAPAFVSDKRYLPSSLRYLYFLHNHPSIPTNISEQDVLTVVQIANMHGGFVETKEGKLPVGVIAFVSNSYIARPDSCDGFYEYTHGSTEVVRWSPDEEGRWRRVKAGTVIWNTTKTGKKEPRVIPTRK